eukprot:CAMPEP_0194525782 /NCGR_PEP_ID=MMETSP0253-20130528/61368_1 /TAXON_ID=2966 /ORGANISM="Noctiluca scintillans" /LENGTH=554 /DNA_ID=CAMNT_0039370549 /DNA_START=114 /DNA_END=1778 /DNA_ORIENTATION=-
MSSEYRQTHASVERQLSPIDQTPCTELSDCSIEESQKACAPSIAPVDLTSEASVSSLWPARPGLPVRLRMFSRDVLSWRSMEVEWDEAGIRHVWSSWTDELGGRWYEAEKLLPSNATNICVHFQVHGPGGPWDIGMVDRHQKCAWVVDPSDDCVFIETLWFRTGTEDIAIGIDAVFELSGALDSCHLSRAWNFGRLGPQQQWEFWPDLGECPLSPDPASVLDAADRAAPPSSLCHEDPLARFLTAHLRVCAAARELLNVHQETLGGLAQVDRKFTGQWVGANVGATATAGLGIASAVFLFTLPPLGLGLGVGSALTGGVSYAGDKVADQYIKNDLRKQLSKDAWNSYMAGELLQAWCEAQLAIGAASGCREATQTCCDNSVTSQGTDIAQVVDVGLSATAVAEGTAQTVSNVIRNSQLFGVASAAVVATQVFGIAGALISTGMAVNGWANMKPGQRIARAHIRAMKIRVVQLQHLLAAVDHVECPLCSLHITLADDVWRCKRACHCFHASCILQCCSTEGGVPKCSCCGSDMDDDQENMSYSVERMQEQAKKDT